MGSRLSMFRAASSAARLSLHRALPQASGAALTAPRGVAAPGVGGALASWWRGHKNTMKRRFRGLYDGKHIKFGNTVSFSHRK